MAVLSSFDPFSFHQNIDSKILHRSLLLKQPSRRTMCIRQASSDGEEGDRSAFLLSDADPSIVTDPEKLPPLIMNGLAKNDFPEVDSGLALTWKLSGETTKYIFKHNYTDFVESCHETSLAFPTSFYGMAMHGKGWEMETSINFVGGDSATDSKCWIATQVMKTVASDGRVRRWQWEMRKHRRPPLMNTWFVESIGSSDKDGHFEIPDD